MRKSWFSIRVRHQADDLNKDLPLNFLIENIGELVTLAPLVEQNKDRGITTADLGKIQSAWLAVKDGTVADFGSGTPNPMFDSYTKINANNGLVIPGLVDSHTHAIFGGNRANEFAMRLDGATYKEIADAGGGIQSTVKGSRNESDESLEQSLLKRLNRFMALGVTTVEVKSGYGLSVQEELRHLKIINQAKLKSPASIAVTCLALHAASPEHATLKSYIDQVNSELLPEVVRKGLADYADAFIETGYFSVKDVEPYAKKAKDLGLGLRFHADEFSDANAASAAVDWDAASADHLQFASDSSIEKMAHSKIVAIILPGTSLFTGIPYTNARRMLDAGCAVAIATDFNPGSCNIDNLPMLATIAGLHCGFKSAEIIAGVTRVPAISLGKYKKGALAKGSDADFLIYRDLKNLDEWIYNIGQARPEVYIASQKIST